ncbi:hypothetical protein L1049_014069 [Liquidambar formosana]|uniref:Uncharacterized protein n=1 Tax=Liquidambar formosana TaxID=63359 RepID=A0AAP0RMG5_LIQFO
MVADLQLSQCKHMRRMETCAFFEMKREDSLEQGWRGLGLFNLKFEDALDILLMAILQFCSRKSFPPKVSQYFGFQFMMMLSNKLILNFFPTSLVHYAVSFSSF